MKLQPAASADMLPSSPAAHYNIPGCCYVFSLYVGLRTIKNQCTGQWLMHRQISPKSQCPLPMVVAHNHHYLFHQQWTLQCIMI